MPIVHEEDEYASCVICTDLKKDSPQWQLAGCGHTFCHTCIQRMLRVTPRATCPLCRRPLTDQREVLAGSRRAAPAAHSTTLSSAHHPSTRGQYSSHRDPQIRRMSPNIRNTSPQRRSSSYRSTLRGQYPSRRDPVRQTPPTMSNCLIQRRDSLSYGSTIWEVIESFDVLHEVRQDPNIQRMLLNTLRDLQSLPTEDRLNRVDLLQVFALIFGDTPPQRYSIAGFSFEILPRSATYRTGGVPSLLIAPSRSRNTREINRPATVSRQATLRLRSSPVGGNGRETSIDSDLRSAIALGEAAEEEELQMALALSVLEVEPSIRRTISQAEDSLETLEEELVRHAITLSLRENS